MSPSLSGFVKCKSGKSLRSRDKITMLNLLNKFGVKCPTLPDKEVENLISVFIDVSLKAVHNIRNSIRKPGKLEVPDKTKKREQSAVEKS